MKKKIFVVLYALLLVALTTYVVLDTFFLERGVIVTDPEESAGESGVFTDDSRIPIISEDESQTSEDSTPEEGKVIDFSSCSFYGDYTVLGTYNDGELSVIVRKYREYNTDIYVAEVSVADPSYLKTAFAKDMYGSNIHELTSSIAARKNAVIAVNGDYYSARSSGIVIRNGVLYRSTVAQSTSGEGMAIYADGHMEIYKESQVKPQSLVDAGVVQAFTFGPGLLKDGEYLVTESTEIKKSNRAHVNPRTSLGVIEQNHYLLVVADGRTEDNKGITLYNLATFLKNLGCQDAYNLDGGGSSAMYFQGEIINQPSYTGGVIQERAVSDIVYFRS